MKEAADKRMKITNIGEAKFDIKSTNGAGFEVEMASLAKMLGCEKIGVNIHRIPAGKKAFPFHNHHVNEELFLVLNGRGTWRTANRTRELKEGDLMTAPAGGAELAHQLSAADDCELLILAISTQLSPEIVEYPDSGKTGVSSLVRQPDGKTIRQKFMIGPDEGKKSYFEGEN